jgi:prepilin-type processing-associated H-X9-DG protein
VGAATGANNPAGPFTRDGRNYLCRIQDCLDGLSNTIFFGEVRSGCSGHINGGWSNSNRWGCFTQVPMNFDSCRTMAEAQTLGLNLCFSNCTWNSEVGFKSLHPGGAQFLFGDGSVHFLSETVDMKVYNYLGDKNDKTAVAIPQG